MKRKKKQSNNDFESELLKLEEQKLTALLQTNVNPVITDDEDMLFLKSLHPYFRTMNPLQKLRIRNQIQTVFINRPHHNSHHHLMKKYHLPHTFIRILLNRINRIKIHVQDCHQTRISNSMSLRHKTFFYKSHLSLLDICGFVNLWTSNCTFPVIKTQLRLSHQVITDWSSFCREVTYDAMAYNTLNNEGYVHMTVNHSLHFKDPETGVHSNSIETSWRHAKASMSNYCRKKKFFPGYLAKHMFTKHCRIYNLDPTAEFFKNADSNFRFSNRFDSSASILL
ncbi:hypothetical protein ACI65C_013306 [Semiaphis heraclei]